MSKGVGCWTVLAIVLVASWAAGAGAGAPMPMTGSNTQGTSLAGSLTDEPMNVLVWSVSVDPDGLGSTCVPLIDSRGNVYVTSVSNTRNFFKYDPDGNLLWSRGIGNGIYGQGCLGEYGETTYWYVPVHFGESGAVCKLDAATGDTVWTVDILSSVAGEAPAMDQCQLIIDAAGDIYFPTADGQVHKVEDMGSSGSEVWRTRTGCSPPNGMGKVAMSTDESVVYNVIGGGADDGGIVQAGGDQGLGPGRREHCVVGSMRWGSQRGAVSL